MADVYGQQRTFSDASEYNTLQFIVQQAIGLLRTAVPVKVTAVQGGGVGKAPTVDVQVTVNMTDGQGNASSHITAFGLPVMRLQGGANAVVCDPIAGDYGYVLCADRDISAVKANSGAMSNPGSFRRHDLADGVYLGAILNSATPGQYVEFSTEGITVHDKNGNIIALASSGIEITAPTVKINGALQVTGEVTAGFGTGDSITLTQHVHPGDNQPPTPGT